MNRRQVLLLTLAHMFTDINQGALPALLPLLIPRHGLSYATAAAVVFSSNIASTVVQPAFGYLADKGSRAWLLPASVALACLGLGTTGLVPSYALLLLAAVACGVGVAGFHPVAARLVNLHSGDQKAGAMSIFGVGGTLGFTLGPLLAALATGLWGLGGTAAMAVPGCLMALAALWLFSAEPAAAPSRAGAGPRARERAAWGPFLRLSATVVGRSMLFFGFNTFIPLYWIHVLGRSEHEGAVALAVFAGASVAGSLAGGWLADRYSRPRVVLGSFLVLLPLIPAFLLLDSPLPAAALLALLGFGLSVPYSAMIVLGQGYLPGQVGLSSGVTLGLAISVGGLAAPALGLVADAHGLRTALALTVALPVCSAALAWTLPPDLPKERAAG
jgi:FSR family fosmidomycin resistance protein-like MFS transporter